MFVINFKIQLQGYFLLKFHFNVFGVWSRCDGTAERELEVVSSTSWLLNLKLPLLMLFLNNCYPARYYSSSDWNWSSPSSPSITTSVRWRSHTSSMSSNVYSIFSASRWVSPRLVPANFAFAMRPMASRNSTKETVLSSLVWSYCTVILLMPMA